MLLNIGIYIKRFSFLIFFVSGDSKCFKLNFHDKINILLQKYANIDLFIKKHSNAIALNIFIYHSILCG